MSNIEDSEISTSRLSKKPAIFRRKWLLLGLIAFVFFCCLAASFGIYSAANLQFSTASGPITVTDVRISTELDTSGNLPEPVKTIRSDEPKIYCYVTVSAPKEVLVGLKWYWEGEMFYQQQSPVQQWRIFVIETLAGNSFLEGEYTVEVYLYNEIVEIVYFTVSQ